MKLKRLQRDEQVYVQIPDEHWKCPSCGSGYEGGDGLVDDDDRETSFDPDDLVYLAEADLRCYQCDNYCTPNDLYKAALKKTNQVTCPCCKGEGALVLSPEIKVKAQKLLKELVKVLAVKPR